MTEQLMLPEWLIGEIGEVWLDGSAADASGVGSVAL